MATSNRLSMPTAGRMAAAVVFGLWGWYLAGVGTPFFDEGRAPRSFLTGCVITGILLGWIYVGRRTGEGYVQAVGHGLSAGFAFSFITLFIMGFSLMMANAFRRRYDGPMEAIVDIFELMVSESSRFIDVTLISSVLVGAVICAWVAEYFAQKYP
ncbi:MULTISPECIES: TrgA family protein [unclassified Yoonia]|uniref:TrgA family protein n=1 Tax=unclassified Yoonia TaxID=2629118 RepID=UPI002AFFE63A|nr:MULTISPECIES: TrgA family protein [unclassified Yoonia]